MEPADSNKVIKDDVLHLGGSKLTPEEVAKALAHHNRHHGGEAPKAGANAGGKKQKKSK